MNANSDFMEANSDKSHLIISCTEATEPFSKKCDIWCLKGYTDKKEKQVGCYVNRDCVEKFSNI